MNSSLRISSLLLPVTLSALSLACGCTGKSASVVSVEATKSLPSPASPVTEPSPGPSPIVTPGLVLGPCERDLIDAVDSLQVKTEEAFVRYAQAKRTPSRENFKLTYAAFQQAQAQLKQLSERYPAARCAISLNPPNSEQTIEVARIREKTLARIASPLAFIEENRLN